MTKGGCRKTGRKKLPAGSLQKTNWIRLSRQSLSSVPLKTKASLICFSSVKVPKTVREWYRKVGAKGGKAKSAAKTAAVRANGKLGGRPKGSKNKVKA